MKKTLLFLVGIIVITFTSCAKWSNEVDRDGSFLGSTTGDWIVIKQSGGVITDVYMLEDVMVQSENNSDGWLFKDQVGNIVNIGGDCKAIRIKGNKAEMFNKYVEYHMEFDSLTYQQRLKISKK